MENKALQDFNPGLIPSEVFFSYVQQKDFAIENQQERAAYSD
jgi:hypothetical protein